MAYVGQRHRLMLTGTGDSMRARLLGAVLWVMAPAWSRLPSKVLDLATRDQSRLWITGASNIRRFTCRASGLSGRVALRAQAARDPIIAGRNMADSPSLSVPVARLDCGIGTMNRHLRETIRAAEFPTVNFRLDTYAADVASSAPTVRIVGRVTVAGVERPLALSARLATDTLGTLHVQGAYAIRMTDFGVRPPRRFGGLLTVHDRVTVHFDVVPQQDDEAVDFRGRCIAVDTTHSRTLSCRQ
jgi:hypothetical protein